MRDIAIVAGVRTPFGRAVKGALKDTRPESYAAALIKELLKRVPQVKGGDVEDLVVGCAMPEGEQGLNIARNVGVLSELPVEVAAVTVNRFCASGLQAIAQAAGRICLGENDIAIAGGVESMSLVPMGGNKMALHPDLAEKFPEIYAPMGITAEKVAAKFGVTREQQDQFAYESHRKATAAWEAGRFRDEVLPVEAVSFDGAGKRTVATFAKDELV
ncbi:MAG: thiolase family protein, partial [Myxococcales bacterium]